MFDLTGWELIFTWGPTGLVFARGNQRVLIDKVTAEVVIAYDFKPV